MTAILALYALLSVGAVPAPDGSGEMAAAAARADAGAWSAHAATAAVGPRLAPEEPEPVTALEVLPEADRTEIVIAVSGDVDYRDFVLESPDRLIVDLHGTRHALPGETFEGIDRGGVRSLRTSQYAPDVVRVVVDLAAPVGYTVIPVDEGLKVSFANPGDAFRRWSTRGSGPGTGTEPVPASAGATGTDEASERTGGSAEAASPLRDPSSAPVEQEANQEAGQISVPEAQPITASFDDTPMLEVLNTFAEFSGRSIVPGSEVQGNVNAQIRDQPWDVALRAILEAQGFSAREMPSGIIRVDNLENLRGREQVEDLFTRPFRINYGTAGQLQSTIQPLLTDRGSISVAEGTNSLVVTDIQRVLDQVGQMVDQLDIRTPQISISAKIIFVNRTDLAEFGVSYELKDSQGNQLNVLSPGGVDEDGDGQISEDEEVETGESIVSLGGSSIAALGNANQRVAGPTLSFLTTLIMGRYTLVNFIEALESLNLSDVQAAPTVTVSDNEQASVLVGERTPIRVIDAAGGQAEGGVIPRASVDIQETGINLEVTPHVTSTGEILLELHAERSSAEVAEADVGFIFRTQEADTRVLLQDGETAVIAGLTVTERSMSRTGIPLLMELPFLGRFFRVTRDREERRDLMILITPHIVRTPSERAASRGSSS